MAASKVASRPAVVKVIRAVAAAVAAAAAAAVVTRAVAVIAVATGNSTVQAIDQVSRTRLTFLFTKPHHTDETISPMLAAKIAAVVIQPRMFIPRLFTRLPMMRRLLVISMISNSKGGVEKPCTIPE